MALYEGKMPTLLVILCLTAFFTFSLYAFSPVAWADEHSEQAHQDDDPFSSRGGADSFGREDPFARRRESSETDSQVQAEAQQQTKKRDNPTADPDRQQVFWGESRSRGSQQIQQALDAELTPEGLEFEGTALDEIVDFLRAEYGLQVQIDTVALDELGIAVDEPISIQVRDITLRSALRIMLRQLELTAVVADEVLLITTREESESRLSVAVYPVGDLTEDGKQSQHLIAAITATVACATWAGNGGGEAEICALPGGLLVVSQTLTVHEQIADVLTAVRKAKYLNE